MADVNEGLWAWRQPGNNGRIIDFQSRGGDSKVAGQVGIEFFGCMAFRLTAPSGLSVFIDPWRNNPSGGDGQFFRFDIIDPKLFSIAAVEATGLEQAIGKSG